MCPPTHTAAGTVTLGRCTQGAAGEALLCGGCSLLSLEAQPGAARGVHRGGRGQACPGCTSSVAPSGHTRCWLPNSKNESSTAIPSPDPPVKSLAQERGGRSDCHNLYFSSELGFPLAQHSSLLPPRSVCTAPARAGGGSARAADLEEQGPASAPGSGCWSSGFRASGTQRPSVSVCLAAAREGGRGGRLRKAPG